MSPRRTKLHRVSLRRTKTQRILPMNASLVKCSASQVRVQNKDANLGHGALAYTTYGFV